MEEFTPDQKRQLVRSLLPKFISQNVARNAALATLKEKGLGLRKTDFLKIWAEVAGQKQVEERARYTPRKFRPTVNTITPTSKNLAREYQHVFRLREPVKGEDILGGQMVSLSSDRLGIVEDMAGILAESLSYDIYGNPLEPFSSHDLVYIGTLRRMSLQPDWEE